MNVALLLGPGGAEAIGAFGRGKPRGVGLLDLRLESRSLGGFRRKRELRLERSLTGGARGCVCLCLIERTVRVTVRLDVATGDVGAKTACGRRDSHVGGGAPCSDGAE